MIVERFFDEKLAQASYLIGCPMTGEAVVVDANRDMDQYIRAAEREGVRITHVTETHIHADYVSGSRELAHRTGAQLYLSDEGDEDWKYLFANDAGAILLKDGDTFDIGNVRLEAVHTPGHTPEHLSFLVTDRATADSPIAMLTGDFVFVGAVGRPDLLERVAGVKETMVASARTLFSSLGKLREQPDYLQIWPGHGAGSACGKGVSSIPISTVGYERLFNWGLTIDDEERFVEAVLSDQPEPPRYFAEMKRINKEGPPILGGFCRPERLPESRIEQVLAAGDPVVDTRPAQDFAAGHIPGSINLPLNRSFNTWAGWLLPYDTDIHLIVNDRCTHCVDEAVRDLAMIGLDRVAGYFGTEVIESWRASRGLATVPQATPAEVRELGPEATILDVRGRAEWEHERLPGAANIPAGYLTDHLDELPRDRPLVLHCQGGGRSAIAASVLRTHGFDNIVNLTGGFNAWKAAGYGTESGTEDQSRAIAEEASIGLGAE